MYGCATGGNFSPKVATGGTSTTDHPTSPGAASSGADHHQGQSVPHDRSHHVAADVTSAPTPGCSRDEKGHHRARQTLHSYSQRQPCVRRVRQSQTLDDDAAKSPRCLSRTASPVIPTRNRRPVTGQLDHRRSSSAGRNGVGIQEADELKISLRAPPTRRGKSVPRPRGETGSPRALGHCSPG